MRELTRQFRYIVAAAREGSISAAAEAELISPSSILLAIDKFESSYNTRLFVRLKSKGLRLTADGHAMISKISGFINEFESLEQDLRSVSSNLGGNLTVGMFSTFSSMFSPRILAALSSSHPDLTVRVLEGSSRQMRDELRNGRVDVALTYDHYIGDGLEVMPLLEAPAYLALAESDPLAREDHVSIDAIAHRPVIVMNHTNVVRYTTAVLESGGLGSCALYKALPFETIRSAASLGVGVGFLHLRPPTDVTYSGMPVVCKRIVDISATPSLSVITRSGERLSRRAQVFANQCEKFFRSEEARAYSLM